MEKSNAPDLTFIALGRNLVRIDLQRIIYLESMGDYVRWHERGSPNKSNTGTRITDTRMGLLSEQLEPFGFVRVHRRYTVNIRAIENFDGESIQLESLVIPVGRTRRQHLRLKLTAFGLWNNHQSIWSSHPI